MEKIHQSILILIVSFAFRVGDAVAQGRGYGMGPGMMGWGYGMGWFGMIFMAIFWIALIIGVILLIRWVWVSTGKGGRPGAEDSPLDILKRRYARGEIKKEEFEQMKKDMGY